MSLFLVLLAAPGYGWGPSPESTPLLDRAAVPPGFVRTATDEFGEWLRCLPLRPGRPVVHLYDGREKSNQLAQEWVIDLDVGRADLQQCADTVIRLWAEYLWASCRQGEICFRYTSGDPSAFEDWAEGMRPKVGTAVRFDRTGSRDAGRGSFRGYLDSIFLYAGTRSLAEAVDPIAPDQVAPGDVWVQAGSPGHAVIVLDVATDSSGARRMMLAQGYMPAQEAHVLRDPKTGGPWFDVPLAGALITPEWTFAAGSLGRFRKTGCARR